MTGDYFFVLGGPDREMYAIIEVLRSQGVLFVQPCQDWEKREIAPEDVPEDFVTDGRTHVYVECFPSNSIVCPDDILIDHHNTRSQERSSFVQVKTLLGLNINQNDLWIEGWDQEGLYGAMNAGAPRDLVVQWLEEVYGAEQIKKWETLVESLTRKHQILIVRTKEKRLLGIANVVDLHFFPEKVPTLFIRSEENAIVEYLYIGFPLIVQKLQQMLSGYVGGNPSSSMYWGIESPKWKIPAEEEVGLIIFGK